MGKFLICESNVEYKGGYDFSFEYKVIDPTNAEILLHIKAWVWIIELNQDPAKNLNPDPEDP